MRAAIYVRVSRADESSTSCEQQVEACRKKAKELGLTITRVYEDDGLSGTKANRPSYLRLQADADLRKFEVVLVWKLDRLGRDGVERETATRKIELRGVRLISCDKDYDSSNGSLKTRKLTRVIKAAVDEYYVDNVKEDIVRGKINAFGKGYWLGGRPYGYKLVPVTDSRQRDPYGNPLQIGTKLQIDKVQAKVVLSIFTRYAAGESPQMIAADLNERGIASPGSTWNRKTRRCNGWARSAIWQMLRNHLYEGTYYWKRRQFAQSDAGTDQAKLRDKSEWLGCTDNAIELAIVPKHLWKLVQLRLAVNKGKPGNERLKSGGRAVYMLSGLLKCGACGSHFVMDSSTHYRCGKALDGKGCTNLLRVRRVVAEQAIVKPVNEAALAPDVVAEVVKEMRHYYAERSALEKESAAKRPGEVLELDSRIARLQDRLRAGDPDMTPDELLDVIAKAEAKRSLLLADAPETKQNAKLLAALPAAAAQYRDQLAKGLKGDPQEAGRARVALRQLVGETIELHPAKNGARHLVARIGLRRRALLGTGTVGRDDRI